VTSANDPVTRQSANPTLDYAPSRVESAARRNPTAIVCLFVALVLGGLMCALLGSLIFDRGRGSPVAVGVSCAAVIASPLSCVAWALRRRRAGRRLVLFLLAGGLAADVVLACALWNAGTDFLGLAWNYNPRLVIGWTTLWILWQALAAAALVPGEADLR
jgi:hypothetical protein